MVRSTSVIQRLPTNIVNKKLKGPLIIEKRANVHLPNEYKFTQLTNTEQNQNKAIVLTKVQMTRGAADFKVLPVTKAVMRKQARTMKTNATARQWNNCVFSKRHLVARYLPVQISLPLFQRTVQILDMTNPQQTHKQK